MHVALISLYLVHSPNYPIWLLLLGACGKTLLQCRISFPIWNSATEWTVVCSFAGKKKELWFAGVHTGIGGDIFFLVCSKLRRKSSALFIPVSHHTSLRPQLSYSHLEVYLEPSISSIWIQLGFSIRFNLKKAARSIRLRLFITLLLLFLLSLLTF
jgi:hypothetical protein